MAQTDTATPTVTVVEQDGPLLSQILAEARLDPQEESYAIARQGVITFIEGMLDREEHPLRVDKSVVDAMIAEIDWRISRQIDTLLHDSTFQQLESAWRGLEYVVDQVDFRENIKLELLDVSKQDLLEDFEDSPEIVKSGMYRTVYSSEYGTFGGEPYGLLVGNYAFGPGPQDMELLSQCASVAAMAHAPFIANVGASFFGIESFEELPRLKDLSAIFEGPKYARWNAFRESEDARNVGLVMPRMLLRLPYGAETVPVKSFSYDEDVLGEHDRYLWGHASIAFATRVADSFAKYRWCPNIIGPQAGGTVEDLPLHQYEALGEIQTKIPTEVQLTERREYELAEEGFIGLTFRKGTNNACFFSANSPQRPKVFSNNEDGKEKETNYRLGTQLPYMFVVNRLAHYLKVLQREQIGSSRQRGDLERDLMEWISQYVVDMDDPPAAMRARRPLREADVTVEDVEGQPGWYRCGVRVRPHFKYMGASFTLSLVGKLDK